MTYEPIYLDFQKQEQKGPEHTKFNPNGRIPTLIDHKNNDFFLWYVLEVIGERLGWLTRHTGSQMRS